MSQKKRSNKVTVWVSNTQFITLEELKTLTGETAVSAIIRIALDDLHTKLSSK